MKHPSTRQLFSHWDFRRGARLLPDRTEIEPGALRSALGDVFILSCDQAAGHPFRLAGTRICALFGRELRGESFLGLWPPKSHDQASIRQLVSATTAEALGFVAAATGTTAAAEQVPLELLVLPLRHRGRTDARMIGVLAPLVQRDRTSFGRLEELELGTYRFLSVPARGEPPVLRAPAPGFRLRHGFRVYDGAAAELLP